MSERRYLSTVSRAFASAVAVAAILGQFFALSHEIAVRHVRCAEHGELTHVPLAFAAASAKLPGFTVVRADEEGGAGEHDHCVTALTLQTGVASPALPASAKAAPPLASLPPERAAPPRRRAFLLAAAPKTSPPRA